MQKGWILDDMENTKIVILDKSQLPTWSKNNVSLGQAAAEMLQLVCKQVILISKNKENVQDI